MWEIGHKAVQRERVLCYSSEDDACSFSSVRILYIFVHVCSVYMCSWMCLSTGVCVYSCVHVGQKCKLKKLTIHFFFYRFDFWFQNRLESKSYNLMLPEGRFLVWKINSCYSNKLCFNFKMPSMQQFLKAWDLTLTKQLLQSQSQTRELLSKGKRTLNLKPFLLISCSGNHVHRCCNYSWEL